MEDAFGITRMDIAMRKTVSIDSGALANSLNRLAAHEPVQYVVGKAYFLDEAFKVSPDVLIPRPETEELVQWILSENNESNLSVWDIGTGSGCIAISLAKQLTDATVYASDISGSALNLARTNSLEHGTIVQFLQSDVLNDTTPIDDLDIIVSNPPYIPESDRTSMHVNVLNHEPSTALFVPNDDPLRFYRKIGAVGLECLKDGGLIYFEVHEQLANETLQMLLQLGYTEGKIKTDLNEKKRMVRVRKSF